MKRSAPFLLGLSLLLTACPGPQTPPPVVKASEHPKVMNGTYSSALWESGVSTEMQVTSQAGRVYLLDRGVLMALDARTGARQATVLRPLSEDVAMLDGQVIVLGGGVLTTHDPVTLAEVSRRALPGRYLSPDGQVAGEASWTTDGRRDVRTGNLLPDMGSQWVLARSSDDGWFILEGGSQGMQVVRAAGEPCLPGPCRVIPLTQPAYSIESKTNPAEGYYLSRNGVTAHDAQGGPAQTLTDTAGGALLRHGDRLLVGGVKPGWIDLKTGTLTRLNVWTVGSALTPDAAGSSNGEFVAWTGEEWRVRQRPLEVTLNVNTTYSSPQEGTVTGTGTIDGRPLTVVGRLHTYVALLAQASPPTPPTLFHELHFMDGTVEVATLFTNTWVSSSDPQAGPREPHVVELRYDDGPQSARVGGMLFPR